MKTTLTPPILHAFVHFLCYQKENQQKLYSRSTYLIPLIKRETKLLAYVINVICCMSSLTYDINGKICHMSAMTYDIWAILPSQKIIRSYVFFCFFWILYYVYFPFADLYMIFDIFLFEDLTHQDFLDSDFSDTCMWVQDPSKWGYP